VKKIKTANYLKLSSDIKTYPPTKQLPDGDSGDLAKNIFENHDSRSEADIKKNWKKKKRKCNEENIYQLGIEVPVVTDNKVES
jgi:uncharacterized protein (DUF1919 family)